MKPEENVPPKPPPQWAALVTRAEKETPPQEHAARATAFHAGWKHGAWTAALLLLAAVAGISVQHLTQAPRPRLRSWTAAAVRCWR
jgi:hypothetical protein